MNPASPSGIVEIQVQNPNSWGERKREWLWFNKTFLCVKNQAKTENIPVVCGIWGLIYHRLRYITITKFYNENHQNILNYYRQSPQLIKNLSLFFYSLCLFMCQGLAFTNAVDLIQASCNIKMFIQPFLCLKQQQMFLVCKEWGE